MDLTTLEILEVCQCTQSIPKVALHPPNTSSLHSPCPYAPYSRLFQNINGQVQSRGGRVYINVLTT